MHLSRFFQPNHFPRRLALRGTDNKNGSLAKKRNPFSFCCLLVRISQARLAWLVIRQLFERSSSLEVK
jgi:hypothetical protein